MALVRKNKVRYLVFNVLLGLMIISTVTMWGCSDKSDNIPTTAENINNLIDEGWTAFQTGDYDQAIERFQSTLKRNVDPDLTINAYRGLGWTYSRTEQYSQAVNNFNFVISLESVSSKKQPVVLKENVPAVAVADTASTQYNNNWQMVTDEYIVSLQEVQSYSARTNRKLGVSPAYTLAAGTRIINLPKARVSNAAGTALGDPLDNSLSFTPDTLVNMVGALEDLQTLNDFYVDAKAGIVEVLPRIYEFEQMSAIFQYNETGYLILRYDNQFVALDERLDDLSKTPPDSVGDVYYLKGEMYNKYNEQDPTTGGTYYQADAYAGLAATYLAQGDFESAIKSAKALMFINQDLKTVDSANYPYKRQLFENDNQFDLWVFYKILALASYNIKDYYGSEKYLEFNMNQGNIVNNRSSNYLHELISAINALPDTAPSGWVPVDLW